MNKNENSMESVKLRLQKEGNRLSKSIEKRIDNSAVAIGIPFVATGLTATGAFFTEGLKFGVAAKTFFDSFSIDEMLVSVDKLSTVSSQLSNASGWLLYASCGVTVCVAANFLRNYIREKKGIVAIEKQKVNNGLKLIEDLQAGTISEDDDAYEFARIFDDKRVSNLSCRRKGKLAKLIGTYRVCHTQDDFDNLASFLEKEKCFGRNENAENIIGTHLALKMRQKRTCKHGRIE